MDKCSSTDIETSGMSSILSKGETHKNRNMEVNDGTTNNDIGTSDTSNIVRIDIKNMMARNSYIACNHIRVI